MNDVDENRDVEVEGAVVMVMLIWEKRKSKNQTSK